MSTDAMMERIAETSPRLKARIAGFLYLIVIIGGIFAEVFVRGRLVVHGDAAATAHNILTHELLYRLGFAAELFYCACNVPGFRRFDYRSGETAGCPAVYHPKSQRPGHPPMFSPACGCRSLGLRLHCCS